MQSSPRGLWDMFRLQNPEQNLYSPIQWCTNNETRPQNGGEMWGNFTSRPPGYFFLFRVGGQLSVRRPWGKIWSDLPRIIRDVGKKQLMLCWFKCVNDFEIIVIISSSFAVEHDFFCFTMGSCQPCSTEPRGMMGGNKWTAVSNLSTPKLLSSPDLKNDKELTTQQETNIGPEIPETEGGWRCVTFWYGVQTIFNLKRYPPKKKHRLSFRVILPATVESQAERSSVILEGPPQAIISRLVCCLKLCLSSIETLRFGDFLRAITEIRRFLDLLLGLLQ